MNKKAQTGEVLGNNGGHMIEILHEDCMAVMARYPDNYFQLACVDPPYGSDIMNGGGMPKKHNFIQWERKDWDKERPTKEYFDELTRVSINQIIWGGNHFSDHLPPSSCWLAWDKISNGFTFSDFELAYTSFSSANRKFVMSRASAYTGIGKIHPTQKPVKLYEWLLANYAKEGDRILDTHLGSGSSAIAAHYGGFDFVGCELDEDYYSAARKRFDAETAQVALF